MLFLPIIFPHVIELPRLHSGLRHLQSIHNVHNESTGPSSNATSCFNVHNSTTSRRRRITTFLPHQTSIRLSSIVSHAGGHPNRTLNAISTFCNTSSSPRKHHPRRRAAAAARRCCIIRNEDHELETPTTSSNNIPSTSRDSSILTPSSTSSTSLCSLPSAQPHPTSKGVKTEQLISACELCFTILLDSISI